MASRPKFWSQPRSQPQSFGDGVVPEWTTPILDDFEPNLNSCVNSEPASSWSVCNNDVDLVDELNGQLLTDGKQGQEHSVSAVDPIKEDREQSTEAVTFQRDFYKRFCDQ